MAKIFWIDIPDCNRLVEGDDQSFVNVHTTSTREEAIRYCQEQFGADEEGRIQLITEGDDGEG